MTENPKEAARRLARGYIPGDFTPEALHTYTDETGKPLYWRIRARLANGDKWIRPMRMNGHGYELGEPDFPEGKPLYRLHELATKPGAPVWCVEGENCADALARLGVLATTAGSASSDERADFTPLAGRTVTLWPDNDTAGIEHTERVAAKALALGCNVGIVDARALELPEGGDCVDWLRVHPDATPADLAKLPRLRMKAVPTPPAYRNGTLVAFRRLSDVQAKPIRWLWPGRIARGKVSILAGNPGLGKSQIAASMAAIVSTGGAWPVDRAQCGRGNVVILSAEDDAEDTIRPRLEAAGADLARVFILDAVVDGYRADGSEIRRAFNLKTDLARLAALLETIGDVALIVIDPITAYLGDADSHKNAEVRALLAPLGELAARHGAAVVCVSHFNKSGNGEALMRVTGSLAFVAAARAAFVVAKDKYNEARRLFLPLKNNIGNDKTGLAFTVQGGQLPSPTGQIETSRVVWEAEAVTITADEAMTPQADPEERSATDEAAEWLHDLLAGGPIRASEVQKGAQQASIHDKALRRARERLGIKPYKREFAGGWWWALKSREDAQGAQDAHTQTVGIFEGQGHLRQPLGDAGGTVEVEI